MTELTGLTVWGETVRTKKMHVSFVSFASFASANFYTNVFLRPPEVVMRFSRGGPMMVA